MHTTVTEQSSVTTLTLPVSVMLKTFSFLCITKKIQISRVCRLWKMLVEHSALWRCVPDTLQGTNGFACLVLGLYVSDNPEKDSRQLSY
ncbi:PREDICTED: F-box/LRR-repeat protein 12-like [Hipposideros armiger]|uniref:F-box/LRR-repeat protein 12-like n=1 Tax=Hipposideros armiger TaxID=186990 RepID=A0A8B7S3S9_HIPAR|nr:PREDICTED: F-box/LRR-repeat protein 12-like [Hipposideros armiger]